MRYPKRKLVLFFALQALGVAFMISLFAAAHRPDGCFCGHDRPSAASVTLSMLLILGELWIIARALQVGPRVWHALLGLGLLFLLAAMFAAGSSKTLPAEPVARALASWHLVTGLLLSASGALAGAADLFERWRRSDETLPEDRDSSAMWPFD